MDNPDISKEVYNILIEMAENSRKMAKILHKEYLEGIHEKGAVIGDSRVLAQLLVYKGLSEILEERAEQFKPKNQKKL